ncbi:MAG TPA: alcohol dehydrogenase catalytic domain-containing protein [Verrucomicrobiae bacterium]|nr:alcohol dehydrogenase catalytic domain-containing protein [Verrucomicrobiae bacterium]
MKAAIFRGTGRFEVIDTHVPAIAPGQALLQLRRVGICGTDLLIFRGGMPHRAKPGRILGHEMVGIIAIPAADGRFGPGDRVVVEPTLSCHTCDACKRGLTHVCENLRFLGIDANGALQEFWAVPGGRLHRVPDSISDDHAAMVEPLAVAVHATRVAQISVKESVVVLGAGTIGSLIGLLAQRAGGRVVLLETNRARREFATTLGLDTCDPTGNVVERVNHWAGGAGADVVIEASGSADAALIMTRLAAVHGRLIVVGIQSQQTAVDLFQVFFRELSLTGIRAYTRADFEMALQLIASGAIDLSPLISHRFSLAAVQEAFELAVSGAGVRKMLIDFTLGKT